ncbi:hypothetical protein HFN_1274 [Helicobacter fennelliae MRY12-0050]|uniref:Uncharacterized protein n=1 Tax=Helicobacter fennelliae MRY12-0050 TaxID=1325130 RepID=T1D1D5_9HELI|nr:hypothetical protein HFN_1274 [Helicobacter fennelliae MRY12-0050]
MQIDANRLQNRHFLSCLWIAPNIQRKIHGFLFESLRIYIKQESKILTKHVDSYM